MPAIATAPPVERAKLGPAVVRKNRIAQNAAIVAAYAGTASGALRGSFLSAIEKLQPLHLALHPHDQGPQMSFEPVPRDEPAWRAIMAVDQLPDGWRYKGSARDAVTGKINSALQLIAATDPDTHDAINTLIGAFVMARLKGFEGGSISSVLGAIWIGLDGDRPVEDFTELIVHETIHNALFLEDMVHGVFIDGEERLGQPDGLVPSAILQIPRGYDKAFHSAMVSIVLAELDIRLGRHEKARASLTPLATTLIGLREKDEFLTPNGLVVLAELEDWTAGVLSERANRAAVA